ENRKSNLYVVHPDGSGLRKLRDSTQPFGWAPQSRRLLVSYRDGVALLDLAGKLRVLPNAACADGAEYSPDGRWIALARCVGGKRYPTRIAIERADGTAFRWLTRGRTVWGDGSPRWAPD